MTKATKKLSTRPSPKAELLRMLTYGRPHGSDAEADFVNKYLAPLPGMGFDKFGNGWVQIGTSPVLWSSHTDTVHHKPGRQAVRVDEKGMIQLVEKKHGLCLGADDAAGVWLMREMIRAEVPGRYVFHAGEEHGGLGSAWIARERKNLFLGIDFAIALDRMGTTSIITHQTGGRCASEAFSASLALKLGTGWKSDSGGTFTDTANYVDLVGECTNLSVGYYHQHGPEELLDLNFLLGLRRVLMRFDATGLVAQRKPGEKEVKAWPKKQVQTSRRSSFYDEVESDELDVDLVNFCMDRPELAARLIKKLGGNLSSALEVIFEEETY